MTIVFAVIVPVVAIAALIVPFLVSLDERESAADTLEIVGHAPEASAEDTSAAAAMELIGEENERPLSGEAMSAWLLPVSAPFETFPWVPDRSLTVCEEDVLAWLEEHAIRTSAPQGFALVTVRNEATTGGALSLGNIRFEGESLPAEPAVHFTCIPSPVGGDGIAQSIQISPNGSPAVYGPDKAGYGVNEDGSPLGDVGAPVTVNLMPGEVAVLRFERIDEGNNAHQGRMVADLMDGLGKSVILVDALRLDRLPVPGYAVSFFPRDNNFACYTPDSGTMCSVEDVVALLAEAARETE